VTPTVFLPQERDGSRVRHHGAVAAFEVWLLGGPADGRFQLVEADTSGGLPPTLVLPQAGFYTGINDDPAPRIDHVYRRADDIDGKPAYRYEPH
jgi:hypothetical protein